MPNYRARRRVAAMRETQAIALELFIDRGFDRVTVEDVAEAAGMSPSTVYRHFGTKEHLALWHEHDVAVDAALDQHLRDRPPLEAIRIALTEALATPWDTDPFQLRRIRYIHATEALHGAAVEADYRDRAELAAGLRRVLSKAQRVNADLLAGAALLAVDVAVDRWQAGKGRPPLAVQLERAFSTLADLDSIR